MRPKTTHTCGYVWDMQKLDEVNLRSVVHHAEVKADRYAAVYCWKTYGVGPATLEICQMMYDAAVDDCERALAIYRQGLEQTKIVMVEHAAETAGRRWFRR